ncbi:hypothetical protein ABQJ54_08895 [Rhodanobacter sp. Si-c]|uniref:PH domain-containing protein n=1 Tax=Rhodanobacter lycopersici TaxID=3162487 RepID=A0ABV3QDF7_9GAMM
MSSKQAIFEFGGKAAVLLGWASLLTIFATLGALSFVHGESGFPSAFAFFTMFFSVIFGLLLLSKSDVVITDYGIARMLWGWKWKEFRWENVDRVAEFPVSNGQSKYVWALNLFPRTKSGIRFTPSGKMFFTLTMRNPSELIDQLNHFISVHHIGLTVRTTPLAAAEAADRLSI